MKIDSKCNVIIIIKKSDLFPKHLLPYEIIPRYLFDNSFLSAIASIVE
jgi:hypothetical protein